MSQPPPRLEGLRIERDEPTRPGRPRLLLTALLLLGIAAIAVVGSLLLRQQPIAVRTTAVRTLASAGDRTVLNASGYVTARREATVSSKVTGKVDAVLIEEGMTVAAGQVLARVDDSNLRASLQLATAQAAAAKAALEETGVRVREAQQEFRRQSDLRRGNVAAEADYDHAEAAMLALQARLAQQQADAIAAERTVAVWQQQIDDTVIRAPFAGTVTSKNAQPGEMISPMSTGGFTRTGICTIVDMQSLEIEIDVNESYINRVKPDQPVEATLDAYPEWKIPCHVVAIIPTADRNKSTVRVRVGFDALDPRILPEMSVKVAFRDVGPGSAAAATAIPRAAVQADGARSFAWVVRNGRAERRAIGVGATVGEDVTVTAGLTTGEQVIINPPAKLGDGARVKEANP